jgi:hypothetical protein
MSARCPLCNAPTNYPAPIGKADYYYYACVTYGHRQIDGPVHHRCATAWLDGDAEALAAYGRQACAQGFHRSPGQYSTEWTRDPADLYGDASFWECIRRCGHVQRHPGYGIGRSIAAAEGALLPAAELTSAGAS